MDDRAPRLVLVDDDQALVSELRCLLEECGYRVVGTADDGLSGVLLVSQMRPDLAIFDFRMPGMVGTEAAAILRREHPEIPIVLLSAYDDEAIQASGRQADVAAYVVKGSPASVLLATIDSVLEGTYASH